MADVSARRVDVVVVYKVDRLTRSLAHFARLVEAFEERDVAFVSITQAFNTTSSMGRLTLNILLSFAQFEREITGKRIRDKIAASKAKGMWMGGGVPLGYDIPINGSRALVINPDEARTVRTIFASFLERGGLSSLQTKLDDEGVRSKRWVSARGRQVGGFRFSRGALRHLLTNRTYLGEIPHKGRAYPGRHAAIVDRTTFDAAQAILDANSRRRRTHVSRADRMLLTGRLFDADGVPMEPAFTRRYRNKLYAYYAAKPMPGCIAEEAQDDVIRRVPAQAIDEFVLKWLERHFPEEFATVKLREVRQLIGRVEIHPSSVQLVIRTKALAGAPSIRRAMEMIRRWAPPEENVIPDPSHAGLIRVVLPVRLVTRGGRKWLNMPDGRRTSIPNQPNPQLVRRLRTGHAIARACGVDPGSTTMPRSMRAPQSARERRLAELAFLAPDLQRAIMRGEIAACELPRVPLSWITQRKILGAAAVKGRKQERA